MSKSIVGIAKSTSQVEVTLDDLQNNARVPSSDISVFDDGILKHTGAGGLSRRSKLRKGR
jgi:hypothetical protein